LAAGIRERYDGDSSPIGCGIPRRPPRRPWCAAHGVTHVWFHRSFGQGSVSDEAVRECREHGMVPIVGGCPLMYAEPVDVAHRCMRWWLRWVQRVPD
jgi:hypothetical protein